MKKISAIIIATLVLASCAKEVAFSIPEAQCSYEFEAAGATQFATVSTTEFTVSCEADWIRTEIYKGSKAHNLRITAGKNTKAADRMAEIILVPDYSSEDGKAKPVTITIHQKGASPFIRLAQSNVSLAMEDTDFVLTSVSNCAFDIESPDWIEFSGSETVENSDTVKLGFNLIGEVKLGESRSGYVTLKGKDTPDGISAQAYIEQIGARWETITMIWGVEDIKYIWQAFGKTTSAITVSTVESADFSSYQRIKPYDKGGFIYTNQEGCNLYVVMSKDAQFKINKASANTSTGNVNRDGNNVERMQMNKATPEVGENSLMFFAPRSGVLEIEAAAPNSGDRKTQILVDGKLIEENFAAPYAIPSGVTEIPITVTGTDGAEVRFFGTAGATNFFQIKYTYDRPVFE